MINIDADLNNADWTKRTWDLPNYKSMAFYDYLESTGRTLEEFRRLPVYKWAVRAGRISQDQWVK